MRVRSGRSSRLAAVLLLPALLATAPSVRSCPLSLAQTDPAAFYRCLILGSAMPAPPNENAPAPCPFASGSEACSSGSCPLIHDDAAGMPRPLMLCIGDPAGGYGLRSVSPHVASPEHLVATLIPMVDLEPDPAPAQRARLELHARPPTRIPEARPPVRGPPPTAMTRSFLPAIA